MAPIIVWLEPASPDCLVWKVCVPSGAEEVPVDFTRVKEETRSFLGGGGYFAAEPDAEGWTIFSRAEPGEAAEPIEPPDDDGTSFARGDPRA
jgi:hypothetical protein